MSLFGLCSCATGVLDVVEGVRLWPGLADLTAPAHHPATTPRCTCTVAEVFGHVTCRCANQFLVWNTQLSYPPFPSHHHRISSGSQPLRHCRTELIANPLFMWHCTARAHKGGTAAQLHSCTTETDREPRCTVIAAHMTLPPGAFIRSRGVIPSFGVGLAADSKNKRQIRGG